VSVRQRVVDRILVITLDRPEKRNAIDDAVARALDEALNRLDDDPSLWVGVLAATGPVFSAGTDLRTPPARTARGGEYGIIRRERSTPLIAAIEGDALGGGFEIALACDLVVASRSARFSLPESRRGIVASSGALFRAAQKLPANVATELLIAGLELDAGRAYELGFVNRLADEGGALDAALELARRICLSSPQSATQSLRAQRLALGHADTDGWAATEQAVQAVLASEDLREGIDAFFERRDPKWRGR